jgi:hypothetical protein
LVEEVQRKMRTMPITDFDRYPLTFGPSPVHPLDRLTRHLGGAQIWAKREGTGVPAVLLGQLGRDDPPEVVVHERVLDIGDRVAGPVGLADGRDGSRAGAVAGSVKPGWSAGRSKVANDQPSRRDPEPATAEGATLLPATIRHERRT